MPNNCGPTYNRFERRIAIATVVTATVVLLLASFGFILQHYLLDLRTIQAQRSTILEIVASDLADDLDQGDRAELQISLQRTGSVEGFRRVRIVSNDGQTLSAWPKLRPRQTGAAFEGLETIRHPVIFRSKQVAVLELQCNKMSFWTIARTYLGMLLFLLLCTTGFALALGLVIAKRTARPVGSIVEILSRAAQSGELATYDPAGRAPLFPDLIEAFNRLMRNLHEKDRDLRLSLQATAIARDEADRANQAKSAFLARMSHEIRTPLNGISAMAQMMTREDLSAAQSERLSIILDSTCHLSVLLNELLDHSEIEAGKIELNERAFEIGELIQKSLSGYLQIAAEKGVQLKAEVPAALEGCWQGDPDRLRQILINLVSNAVKFTPAGMIDVILSQNADENLELTVRDTGIGIAPSRIHSVFDGFRQADSGIRSQYGGTGLGLSISRQLAEYMGGSLTVVSEQGKGSAFTLTLPLHRADQLQTGGLDRIDPKSAGKRPLILAADDNPINRQVLASILSVFEVDLFQVENGYEAVRQFSSTRFDLVLLDVQMPVMDGLAACRQMRTHEKVNGLERTPILALSASSQADQTKACQHAGMDGLIAKPIEIDILIQQVSLALSQGTARTALPANDANAIAI